MDKLKTLGLPLSDYLPQGFAEAALEQLQEGVVVTEASLDSPGPRIIWVNSSWERITGYSADQFIGATPAILQGPETWRETLDRIRSDLEATGQTEAELINYRADGTPFRMSMSVSPLRNEKGEITHFIAIERDITKNKIDASQLRQLEALTRIQREIATQGLNLKQMRQRVADMALEITRADGAIVEEVKGGEIVYRAVAGKAEGHAGLRFPLDQSLSALAYKEAAPQLYRDTEIDSRVPFKEEARNIGFVSGIVVPLSYQDTVLGVLKVFASEANRFSMEHLQLLRLASGVLGASLFKASEYAAEVERRTTLMDTVPALIASVDSDYRYQEVNAAFENFFGRAAEEIRGSFVWDILGEEGFNRLRPYIEAVLQGKRVSYESDILLPDGVIRTLQGEYYPQYGQDGGVQGLYAVVHDVTEARSSRVDYLTGLANRRQFDWEGARLLELAKRHKEPLSLIMLDLDHFKAVNDTYGHSIGDEVLKDIAALISQICRKSDLAGRWGGEEFVVLLPKTGEQGGAEMAERLREKVAGHTFPEVGSVTVSLGVAGAAAEDSLQGLVDRVDRLLAWAKESGRNRVKSTSTGE